MKAYTDFEQSKKLAQILPSESADMCYYNDGTAIKIDANSYKVAIQLWHKYYIEIIPCWSLAGLLNLIPQVKLDSIKQSNEKLWRCLSYFKSEWNESIWYDNPIDACYEMILELCRQKLL